MTSDENVLMRSRFVNGVTSLAVACSIAIALLLVPGSSSGKDERHRGGDRRSDPPRRHPADAKVQPQRRDAGTHKAARSPGQQRHPGSKPDRARNPAAPRRHPAGRTPRPSRAGPPRRTGVPPAGRHAGAGRTRKHHSPPPGNLASLSPAEQLGKAIFLDQTLSDPVGLSCATCHLPAAGFTSSSSAINAATGTMPGVVPGRFGARKPQAVSYSSFSPVGPVFSDELQVWLGGNFWDGRAPDNAAQARMPFLDPNEMSNAPIGPYPPHAGGYSPLVVAKIRQASYATLFLQVFGDDALAAADADVYSMATQAIAAFEASSEVNPFSSKFDASINGTPPRRIYRFKRSEEHGRVLFFGKARCAVCHSSSALDSVQAAADGRDVFTTYAYVNIGVPGNPANPFYNQRDGVSNPHGFNPWGRDFIDYGLGANPNPGPGGLRFMTATPGDVQPVRGLFKTPSLRNVDLRPQASFVKAYMHNGVFKSLEDVVHFLNKRNIAVGPSGDEAAFDLRVGPPPGYTPLFPPPEVTDNVQNVAGTSPDGATFDVASNGLVGNLGLTAREEADLVDFLRTLSDGFTGPGPGTADAP